MRYRVLSAQAAKSFSTILFFFVIASLGIALTSASGQTARDIILKVEENIRGDYSYAELKMTIVRPTWQREIEMKSWSLGEEFALTLITSPARDKGTAFLKRGNEIWNWQPRISRSIKLPPSMMTQSWMGSDFTNDDLVRQSSIVHDYDHRLIGEESLDGYECHIVELIPMERASVVWGRIVMWIEKDEFMQLKTEFYDEDDFLVNTMSGSEIMKIGGKQLPAVLKIIPAEEDGHMTVIEYKHLDFDLKKPSSFYSLQNLKRIR